MQYEHQIQSAYEQSKVFGVEPDVSPVPFGKMLPDQELIPAIGECIAALPKIGILSAFDLAGKCIPVHAFVQEILSAHGISSVLTIGDRTWHDYIYCEMSYEQIAHELSSPNIRDPLKAHVWLTLSDGTILDLTSQPHMDQLQGDQEYPIEKSIVIKRLSEKWDDGNYRPFLVGPDFLINTGALGGFYGLA